MQSKPAPGQQPANAQPAGSKTAAAGAVDVQKLIDAAYQDIPQNLREPLDRIVLSGMRIMFDKSSHEMMLAELDKPGPLDERLSNGMISLVYMLWEKSNKTIPPQLVVPATLILTLHAFEFLQKTEEPDATKEVLGSAVQMAVQGVMDRFGADEATLQKMAQEKGGQPGAAPAGPSLAGGGMLDSIGGA